LRLDQLRLERSPLADVGESAGELDRPALRILEQHRLVVEMAVRPVGALPAIFDREAPGLAARGERGQRLLAILLVKPVDPQRRILAHIVESEAGDRGQVAADEIRGARIAVYRF
jgi:hypothetical protein